MNQKINILYIFHVSSFGGGSFCLLNMIKRLDREIYNATILLKNRGPLCDELEKQGVSIIFEKSITTVPYNRSIFTLNSIRQIFFILFSLGKVKFWIRKLNPDIVHINTMMMYPYAIPAFKLRKRVIIHMRENWPNNQHQIQFNIARKTINKYSHTVIAINKASAEIINLPLKTKIIYDWIDFEGRDKCTDLNKLFNKDINSLKIILFLGGIQRIKGALEVVDVFHYQIHSKDVRLLFVGCNSKIISDIHGFKGIIKKIFHFFNYYTYSDKIKLIAQKDERIVFLPPTNQVKSLIEQSFCVVSFHTIPHANLPIAEAAYLGKPSISAETSEAIEYSDNGKATLLFKINNKEEFKNKILLALDNEQLINQNAKDGMKNVQEKFDSVINSDLLNNIYKQLIF